MKEYKMELLKVSGMLSDKIFKIKVFHYDAEEKTKTYKIDVGDSYRSQVRMLKKDKLMIVDSMMRNELPGAFLNYHVWCLPADKDTAVYKVYSALKKRIEYIFQEAEKMNKVLYNVTNIEPVDVIVKDELK
jgi:hypothetical protein